MRLFSAGRHRLSFVSPGQLVAVLLACLPASVACADSAFDVSLKAKGDVTVWQSDKGRITVRHNGKRGKFYSFAFARDSSKGAPLRLTLWSLRNGNTVKVRFDSATIRFEPHDCSFVVGTCHYKEIHSEFGTRLMVSDIETKGDTWVYTRQIKTRKGLVPFESGQFTVEPSGYVIDRTFTFYFEDGQEEKGWTRRIPSGL